MTDTTAYRRQGFTHRCSARRSTLPPPRRASSGHILAVGLPRRLPPAPRGRDRSASRRRCAEAGAFVAIPHPHWYGLTLADALVDRRGPCGRGLQPHEARSTATGETGWCCSTRCSGRRPPRDGHRSRRQPLACGRRLGGWVMVKAERNEPGALLDALKAGRGFYATQGPEILGISRDGDELRPGLLAGGERHAAGTGQPQTFASTGRDNDDGAPAPVGRAAWWPRRRVSTRGRRAWSNPSGSTSLGARWGARAFPGNRACAEAPVRSPRLSPHARSGSRGRGGGDDNRRTSPRPHASRDVRAAAASHERAPPGQGRRAGSSGRETRPARGLAPWRPSARRSNWTRDGRLAAHIGAPAARKPVQSPAFGVSVCDCARAPPPGLPPAERTRRGARAGWAASSRWPIVSQGGQVG